MRSSLGQVLVVLVTLPSFVACAAHRGTVSQDVQSLEDYIAKVRQASVTMRAPAQRTALPTVEGFDSRLAVALAALQVFPSPERHMQAAAEYRRLGITDKAHEQLTLAVSADRRNAGAYDGLARLWRDWGFPGKGLPDAYRAVYFAPGSPEARNTLGTVLQRLGRYTEARRQYDMALALNPAAAYALNNLCAIDLLEGRPDSAVTACSQALVLEPNLLVAQENLQRANALLAAANTGDQNARQ